MAVIDIDFFKRINDSYGHDVGDQTLVHLARILRPSFRASDILGRLGGEEFAVLLAGAETLVSVELMNHFRETLAATPLILDGGESLHFTISIGVASLQQAEKAKTSIAALSKAADTALYEAKRSGRNRVCLAA